MYILAHFTQSGTPTTGLTPTLRAFDLGDDSVELSDVAMSEVGSGFYKYDFTTYSENTDYAFTIDGGSGLEGGDRYKAIGNDDFDVPADIVSLNDVSTSEVLTQVSAGLATYDGPTHAELTGLVASVTGDINSLNDLSIADLTITLISRLAAYDSPTHAELIGLIATVTGDIDSLNDISSSDVETATDAALATYDGPTHAELTGLVATITGDIDGLNDLSAVQVNSEVDDALSTYDAPSYAEMVSALAVLSGDIIAEITAVQTDLKRALGLLHENILIDETTYVSDNMTAARVRFFDSGTNVPATGDGSETTGLIATYTASGAYTGTTLDWFRMEKV